MVPDTGEGDKIYTDDMNKSGSYKQRILYSILFLFAWWGFISRNAYGGDQINDTTTISTDSTRHSLYAGSGYGSNMIYLGSTISQDQPYSYGSLIYGFNDEFFASVSAVHLSGLDPFMAFYTVSASYNHVFNSWFDISTGLYRYQVTHSLTDTLFSSFTYGDLTVGLDWQLIYSKLSMGRLFSEDNQTYFQFRNSRYFKTPEFFNKKAYISFDPYVNLLFGTLIKTETLAESSVTFSFPYRQWRKYNQASTSTTTYTKKFGLMEIDFGLPVSFNTDFMTFEAEASYILPMFDDPDYPGSKGFLFMITAFFRIF